MGQEVNKQEKKVRIIEKVFGKIELFRLLNDETVLGTIDEIPVYNGNSIGRGKATITDKRLILESEILGKAISEKKVAEGRDIIYYETELNKIDGIVFKSSDLKERVGNIPAFVILLLIGIVLAILDAAVLQKWFVMAIGVVIALISFIFVPRSRRLRKLNLQLRTSSGTFLMSDNKDADFPLVVTKECIDKMTLLAKGIRQAQQKI